VHVCLYVHVHVCVRVCVYVCVVVQWKATWCGGGKVRDRRVTERKAGIHAWAYKGDGDGDG